MESIDALALAIKEFEGGVVIVSHDFRKLLQVDPSYDMTRITWYRADFPSR
jgi:ATPase subunit of ABC transporter with duplicated ATPase domains